MRTTILVAFMICTAALVFAQDAAATDQPAADQPSATADQPAADQPAADQPAADQPADVLAEVERLSAKLEEANGVIDELRAESYDLKNSAQAAEDRAATARGEADAANAAVAEAEKKAATAMSIAAASDAELKLADEAATSSSARAEAASARAAALGTKADALATRADALTADAERLKAKVAELEAKLAGLESGRDVLYGKLASFGSLRIDPKTFPEILRSGFADSKTRLGTWKLKDGILAQTDRSQYFARMTFPLVQSAKPVLYSFDTKAGAKGWVGTGLHLFADKVKKSKGFGEGKSLLVWLTRDAKVRGNAGSYLQVYRSDSDASMERVLDAKIKEKLDGWNRIDVLYEPANEFLVIAVNGTVRAAYRTWFGIGNGVTMSLRTLGEGVQFRNLEVRK